MEYTIPNLPIITISRGSYSKGREIAEKVAERLGYECLSRDLLEKIRKARSERLIVVEQEQEAEIRKILQEKGW
jgi:hypothetical protein